MVTDGDGGAVDGLSCRCVGGGMPVDVGRRVVADRIVVCAGMGLLAARRAAIAARTLRAAALTPRLSRYLSRLGAGAQLLGRGVLPGGRRRRALGRAPEGRDRSPVESVRGEAPAVEGMGRCDPRQPLRPALHRRQPRAVSVRARHAGAIQPVLGGHRVEGAMALRPRRAMDARRERLVRAQRGRLLPLQGLDGEGTGAGRGAGPGAGPASPRGRREHRDAARRLEPRRGVVPHERHRGGHGGGAAGALQYPEEAHRVLRRGLPRLVGWRADGPGQRAEHRRLPDAQGSPSGVARCHPAARPRDRGRARQSDAIVSPEHAPAQRRHPADERRCAGRRSRRRPMPGGSASSEPSATRRGSR